MESGEAEALCCINMLPVCWPCLLGVALTVNVQLAPGSMLANPVFGVKQPLATKTFDGSLVKATPEATMSSLALPLLAIVTLCGALVCPTGVGGNVRLLVETVICAWPGKG